MNKDKIILDSDNINSVNILMNLLYDCMNIELASGKTIVFLCIGTDRSTGDSLGPLVGDKLDFLNHSRIVIYGNLKSPVHAKNLQDTLNLIKISYTDPYIIAIDASLGSIHNVGKIIIENKPLTPGAAMNKKLPPVGDLSITGIVNISGSLEFMVLQNTRLYTVMRLADLISTSIFNSVSKLCDNSEFASIK
ncbi:spore protease YyaC [Clostridium oryzae]|uniref:Sporulation protein YyaC n=1 Tax=Clostridium oryzae TaxID=1450648 RepID=A0A1V4IFP4_9CLOT|nr:spore protease YyaC [Clostridium oryzae]OPJ58680.1 hypothetical protein CLORY_35140 [Clostridium oryzae]